MERLLSLPSALIDPSVHCFALHTSALVEIDGFSVEGQENIQEILSKRIYLCQFVCALSVLRTGGNFVCKVFDLFTPFSVGLVYLLYRVFDRVAIQKPNTSRPANSERYVVCKAYRGANTRSVTDYLLDVNRKLDELNKAKSDQDVTEVVPHSVLEQDSDFFQYVKHSNETFAERQAMYLEKYKVFAQNPRLVHPNQEELRRQCMEFWRIPDMNRSQPPRAGPTDHLAKMLPDWQRWIGCQHQAFRDLGQIQKEMIMNHFCVVTCGQPVFILSCGGGGVYQWERMGRWERVDSHVWRLPSQTFFLGEITSEYTGQGRQAKKRPIAHIIDAFVLNGRDMRSYPYAIRFGLRFDETIRARKWIITRHWLEMGRLKKIYKFCRAISHKHSLPNVISVKPANGLPLEQLDSFNGRFKQVPALGPGKIGFFDTQNISYFPVLGLLLLDMPKDPWIRTWSKTHRKPYFFNPRTGESLFDAPQSSAISPIETYERRLYWRWNDPQAILSEEALNDGILTLQSLLEHIQSSVEKRPPPQAAQNTALATKRPDPATTARTQAPTMS